MDLKEGIYEQVINESLSEDLKKISEKKKEPIPEDASSEILAAYMQKAIYAYLKSIDNAPTDNKVRLKVEACNRLLRDLPNDTGFSIDESSERLLSIGKEDWSRPISPMSSSTLFTGGAKSLPLYEELNREVGSADEIDFIISFIKGSGLCTIYNQLSEFTQRGGKLRVLTTTYMGATEWRAVQNLTKLPNTQVKISYDTKCARLHAKAYIFRRNSGFSTAFIGSSNLSKAAVSDGLEWNIKVTNQDTPQILSSVSHTFDSYWNSRDFEDADIEKLKVALRKETQQEFSLDFRFDIIPHNYQEEILDQLQARREIHKSFRNLVVAATGTGKTVISAFDYKRYRDTHLGKRNTLLFVAHRKEILRQSLNTFRAVLKNPNFGEMMTGDTDEPASLDHLFVSIQTLNSRHLHEMVPDFYDFIIVDETHHGYADSYQSLFTYFKPKILLGLTATPERFDGGDIL